MFDPLRWLSIVLVKYLLRRGETIYLVLFDGEDIDGVQAGEYWRVEAKLIKPDGKPPMD